MANKTKKIPGLKLLARSIKSESMTTAKFESQVKLTNSTEATRNAPLSPRITDEPVVFPSLGALLDEDNPYGGDFDPEFPCASTDGSSTSDKSDDMSNMSEESVSKVETSPATERTGDWVNKVNSCVEPCRFIKPSRIVTEGPKFIIETSPSQKSAMLVNETWRVIVVASMHLKAARLELLDKISKDHKLRSRVDASDGSLIDQDESIVDHKDEEEIHEEAKETVNEDPEFRDKVWAQIQLCRAQRGEK